MKQSKQENREKDKAWQITAKQHPLVRMLFFGLC